MSVETSSLSRPRFSILLPTLRRKLFDCTLHSIRANSGEHSYEIIVVGPFKVSGPGIHYFAEDEPRGCIDAFARAYERSSGDIIVAMTDDTIALPGWLDAIGRWIEEGERRHFPYCIGLNRVNVEIVGTVCGKYYAYFPALSRKSIAAVGGLFYDPSFVGNWADPDLGLRIWAAGGRVEFCKEAHIANSTAQTYFADAVHKGSSNFVRDSELFWKKWSGLLPEERRNWQFRDVNVDYLHKMLCENSISIDYSAKRNGSASRAAEVSSRGVYVDVLGFSIWTSGYRDHTSDVMISVEPYFSELIGPINMRFPTVYDGLRWIVSTVMNLPYPEGKAIGEIEKLHTGLGSEVSEAIVALQIAGASNSRSSRRDKFTVVRLFGRTLLSMAVFRIDSQNIYVGARAVDPNTLGLGHLIYTRFKDVYVARDPRTVIAAILREASLHPKLPRLCGHLMNVPWVARLLTSCVILSSTARGWRWGWKRILLHGWHRIVGRTFIFLRTGKAIYGYEVERLQIGEWGL